MEFDRYFKITRLHCDIFRPRRRNHEPLARLYIHHRSHDHDPDHRTAVVRAKAATDGRVDRAEASVTVLQCDGGGRHRRGHGKRERHRKVFQFKVTDAAVLKSLKVGQGVYANFGAMQVSLDGSTVCCSIISIGSPPPASAPVAKPAPGAPAAAAPPETSTPPASRAATPSQTIAQIKPLPTMSYGTPHPI